MEQEELKGKIRASLKRLQENHQFKLVDIRKKITELNPNIQVTPVIMTRLNNPDFKYNIKNIDQYWTCLQEIESDITKFIDPNLYFVGYFLDNQHKIRKTILEIWEGNKKIKLYFQGQDGQYKCREGSFEVNTTDNSISFTTKDRKGENYAFIITHNTDKPISHRSVMTCVYAARYPKHNPVAGKMIFHKKQNRVECENATINDKTFYQLYQKRIQYKGLLTDQRLEKINHYIGVYKGYYFLDKENGKKIAIGVGEIQTNGSIRFKVINNPYEYEGIVKKTDLGGNLYIGVNWEIEDEYFRYNWVLKTSRFWSHDILIGTYSGTQQHNNNPVGGKLILVKQKDGASYQNLKPEIADFEDIPIEAKDFFRGNDYPFIEKFQKEAKPLEETDPRLFQMQGNYICYKLSAIGRNLLCYPMKINADGSITKKGEYGSMQYGRGATFFGGNMLAVMMESEEKYEKKEAFYTHKLFFIGKSPYSEIQHLTGVGTSVTNDEMAARCGREILLTTATPFEELRFQKYDLQEVPTELEQIAKYFYGKTNNLIIDSPSRINKSLQKTDNIGIRCFHSACYNALRKNYTFAKEELLAAKAHFFPANIVEITALKEEYEQGCLSFLKGDSDFADWEKFFS